MAPQAVLTQLEWPPALGRVTVQATLPLCPQVRAQGLEARSERQMPHPLVPLSALAQAKREQE